MTRTKQSGPRYLFYTGVCNGKWYKLTVIDSQQSSVSNSVAPLLGSMPVEDVPVAPETACSISMILEEWNEGEVGKPANCIINLFG